MVKIESLASDNSSHRSSGIRWPDTPPGKWTLKEARYASILTHEQTAYGRALSDEERLAFLEGILDLPIEPHRIDNSGLYRETLSWACLGEENFWAKA